MKMVNNSLSFDKLTEHNVVAVQPGCFPLGDIELRWISILFSEVAHAKEVGLGVEVVEIFVREEAAVDGFATGAVAIFEISSLYHKPFYAPMDHTALVPQRLPT